MKIEIIKFHLEPELVNNELRLIMTSTDGKEYVMSQRTACSEGGQAQLIVEKEKDWYFNPNNK